MADAAPHSRDVPYLPAVDGLRALAVGAVIAFHLAPSLLPSGLVGVDIFFVISGFVVPASILGKPWTGFWPFALFFYTRRLRRIAPALIVCLLVTTVASVVFIPHAFLAATIDATGIGAFFGVSNFVLARLANAYFSPTADYNPFTQTWSLGIEEQFYLLFPILTGLLALRWGYDGRRRGPIAIWLAVTLASFIYAIAASRRSSSVDAFYLPQARFWELGAGLLVYLALPSIRAALARALPALADAAGILATGAVVASLFLAKAWAAYPAPVILPAVLGSATLIALIAARSDALVTRFFAFRPFVRIGHGSYSLYLWHWPIIVMMRWTIGMNGPVGVLIALSLTATAAFLSWRFVETPLRRSAWLSTWPKTAIIAAGFACLLAGAKAADELQIRRPQLSASVTADLAIWEPLPNIFVPHDCEVSYSAESEDGGTIIRLTPRACKHAMPARRIFVLGDSHAAALQRALSELAGENNATVELDAATGWAALPLYATQESCGPDCRHWIKQRIHKIADQEKSGDVVFLPSFRMSNRLADQAGPIVGATVPPVPPQTRQATLDEASKLLKPIERDGVKIVVSAPLPLFRIAPFRCMDWFNHDNPLLLARF